MFCCACFLPSYISADEVPRHVPLPFCPTAVTVALHSCSRLRPSLHGHCAGTFCVENVTAGLACGQDGGQSLCPEGLEKRMPFAVRMLTSCRAEGGWGVLPNTSGIH